jgi:hypothetical protein
MNNENKNPNVEEELKKQSQEAAENEQTTSEASEAQENASSEEKELTAEEKLGKELEEAQKVIDEQKDKYLRLSAEFDNFRKRTLKEKAELIKNGGSYIEKVNRAYYIRSEGMITDLKDIEQIVVTNRGGIPVHVSDIAKVRYGAPKRFGAMTKDGEGECVGGIAMMLKGANANVVTQELEKRVAKVQKMLPEGVSVEPYLNRSELVNRNISTVIRNLVEGAIIVFLVLILFLGNVRAGLIVASVIPLAMLFAFILMRVFGVSANLMSLGAIDFGIVVDGSIVILEGILAHIYGRRLMGRTLSKEEMDAEVEKGAGNVVRSATFAVLIILIVFFPILTLPGNESPSAEYGFDKVINAGYLADWYLNTFARADKQFVDIQVLHLFVVQTKYQVKTTLVFKDYPGGFSSVCRTNNGIQFFYVNAITGYFRAVILHQQLRKPHGLLHQYIGSPRHLFHVSRSFFGLGIQFSHILSIQLDGNVGFGTRHQLIETQLDRLAEVEFCPFHRFQ